jgi:hypothetical protein
MLNAARVAKWLVCGLLTLPAAHAANENLAALQAMVKTLPAGTYVGEYAARTAEYSPEFLKANSHLSNPEHVAEGCQVNVQYFGGEEAEDPRAEVSICDYVNGHCAADSSAQVVIRANQGGFWTKEKNRCYLLDNSETGAITDIGKAPQAFRIYSSPRKDVVFEVGYISLVAADRGKKGGAAPTVTVYVFDEMGADGEGLNVTRKGGTCVISRKL